MIAGATPDFWLGFHAAVLAALLIESLLLPRIRAFSAITVAALWTLTLVALSLGLALWLGASRDHQTALEFVSGYTVEYSLSIDNLFVFLLLFQNFGLSARQQRNALAWGIVGAMVMRALFILAGVALLERFLAVQYIFGAVLLYAAIRLLLQKPHQRRHRPAWIERLRTGGHSPARLLLFAVLAIEATDLVFALDSIPAVIAVSRQPFVIYTSNICAILGLRSLYFVLAGMLDRLSLLHYGLGLVLAFVAGRMLLGQFVHISVGFSLTFILGTVGVFTLWSLLLNRKHPKQP